MAWISMANWRKFQHYDPAKRTPPWVKNYTDLLARDSYLNLSPGRRALLHGLWLAYGLACTCPRDREDLTCTCLRLDVQLLNRRLGLAAKLSDYEALSDAGFLHIIASKPLAGRYQVASSRAHVAETETETYKPNPTPPLAMGNGGGGEKQEGFDFQTVLRSVDAA